MPATALESRSFPNVSALVLLKAIVCMGAIFVLFERVSMMAELPLWLDETWSAMIATRADWRSFWREAWLDCNPPLYYLVLSASTGVLGESNFALRLPSLLFTTGAALTALRFGPRELGALGRWTWAGLLMFWLHAFTLSIDARGYGLLLLLSVIACIFFARLFNRLTLRLTTAWVGVCTLMFMTHYYAAALIAAQGLILIARHRLRAFEVWPAGLVGIPALAWFAFQLPRLQDYARPDVAWYDPLQVENAVIYLRFLVGHPAPTFMPLVILTLLGGLILFRRGDARETPSATPEQDYRTSAALVATALSGVLAVLIAFAVGYFQASLTSRYFTPMVPPILLGLTLFALRSKRQELVCLLLTVIYLSTSSNFHQLREFAFNRNGYGYEEGSAFIAQYDPTHLVFLWDHPAAKILDKDSLAAIGGYFLHRAGITTKATALVAGLDDDPNVALAKAATGERPAVIWLYNKHRKSAARRHPPRLADDPAWECRSYIQPHPRGELGAVACVRKDALHV